MHPPGLKGTRAPRGMDKNLGLCYLFNILNTWEAYL
jgi:hypothetical protein